MSLTHQILLSGKVLTEPKISKGSYGNTAGFAIAPSNQELGTHYVTLKLTSKPNKYTNSDGLPLELAKGSVGTFMGNLDGYVKEGEKYPAGYPVKFGSFYPYSGGKPINSVFGIGYATMVGKLADSGYWKVLVREAKKKMKPTDDIKYRFYTLTIPEDIARLCNLEVLKGTVPFIVSFSGRLARLETLLGQEPDKTKPAQATILVDQIGV